MVEFGMTAREERKLANKGKRTACAPVSTPLGAKQRATELRAKLLSVGNSETVLRKLMDVIRDDEHPAFAACMKMAIDRMLPVSSFEDKKDGARTAITISISGMGEAVVEGETIENGDG